MPKLKGRAIKKEEAIADINRYLEFRDTTQKKIVEMLEADAETRGNKSLLQYYKDEENSFFFSIKLLKELIAKGESNGADCIRIYYGAAVRPTEAASITLFDEMKINEGSSTLVLMPCKLTVDSTSQEITKVENVIYSDGGDNGGQWPGGSKMPKDGRVGVNGKDETLPTNISVIPISVVI